MTINTSIKCINDFANEKDFFDFAIKTYSKDSLLIVGSTDLSYYHNIEIGFNKVQFVCCASDWRVITSKPVMEILSGDEAFTINSKFRILQGQTLIKLHNEDNIEQWISCESLSVQIKDVRYHESDNPLRK